MQSRGARITVLLFILAFPALMVAASPKGFRDGRAIPTVLGVEAILLGGIAFASIERKRRDVSTPPVEPNFQLGKPNRRPLSGASSRRAAGSLIVPSRRRV